MTSERAEQNRQMCSTNFQVEGEEEKEKEEEEEKKSFKRQKEEENPPMNLIIQ